MAEERLFGNSISDTVVKEIEKREKLLSKTNNQGGNLLPDSTDNLKSLRYTTQRGAWVRMISSVNTDFREETIETSVGTGTTKTSDNTLAKNFILTGGEITSAGTKREGISFGADRNTQSSYRKTATLGVRPEAGITSFSIKHKGTYGSIREAEISFNVWSKEDLDRAQTLYLRPGVHMIVEWGHTLDSNVQPVNIPNADLYFQKSTREAIQKLINRYREANLSYEGFIGLVTNFSWSLREDGGYDCSVRIISTGAVMESLTTIQGAGHLTTAEAKKCKGQEEDDEIEESKKSTMHDFILGVTESANIFFGGGGLAVPEGGPIFNKRYTLTGLFKERFSRAVRKILEDNNISLYGFETTADTNVYFRYITIRDLLKFLNASEFFPKAPNGEKPSQFYIEPTGAPGTSTYPRFKTFPEHFSLDIKTCLLPKPPVSDNVVDLGFLNDIRLKDDLYPIFLNSSFLGETNNIQSILVELDFLKATLDGALSSEEPDIYKLNVFSFMQNLLTGINNALGNITDLDLHFKDEESGYIIVDREAVTTKEAIDSVSSLSFTGISNTVQKVSIQTKITPQLTSQIAISAQGTKGLKQGDNNSNLAMIQWNEGIEDRFNPKDDGPADKQPPTPNCGDAGTGGIPTDKEILAKFQADLVSLQQRLNEQTKEFGLSDLVTVPLTRGLIALKELDIRVVQARVDNQEAEAAERARFNLENPFVESFLEPWANAFKALSNSEIRGWFSYGTEYKANLFSRLRRFGIAYFRERYFTSIGGADKENKTSDPGLIPIELSITLDGIGGLKIGQVFKLDRVENFLPEAYKGYGFIITAIDSTIENNKWNTTIKALTFKLPTQSTANSTSSVTSRSSSTATSTSSGTSSSGAVLANSATSYIQSVPWSAGFISYVVKGAVANFPSQGTHTGYAQSIRNNPRGWQVLNPASVKPIPGDIIVRNRGEIQTERSQMKFNTPTWSGNSHGDVVVSANNDAITFIGGNLGDTTVKQVVKRGGQPVKGGILPTTGKDLYFAILRPPPSGTKNADPSGAAGIVQRANAEYNKWSAGKWTETTPAAYSTIYEYYKAGGIAALRTISTRRGAVALTPLPPPSTA